MAAGSRPGNRQQAPHRVHITNINRGTIGASLAHGMLDSTLTLAQSPIVNIVGVQYVESGPYLDAGRNRAITEALTNTDPDGQLAWDWLLFIDSDMVFTHAHVETLFRGVTVGYGDNEVAFHPILGGLYLNTYSGEGIDSSEHGDAHYAPCVFEWGMHTRIIPHAPDQPVEAFQRMSSARVAALPPPADPNLPALSCLVDCIGTGFLAIHHTLIRHMQRTYEYPTPWFTEPIVNGVSLGEDLGFALRCGQMGYRAVLNRACRVGHDKTIRLWPEPLTG